jgi:hypothetical protein
MDRRDRLGKIAVFFGAVLVCAPPSAARPTGLEGYQILRITVPDEPALMALQELEAAGRNLEIWSDFPQIGFIEVRVSPRGKEMLVSRGFEFGVVIEDLQAHLDALFTARAGADFFEAYRDHQEHMVFLQSLAAEYPQLATVIEIGQSVEGREILGLRVSGPGQDKPGVIYFGAQHGNEIVNPAILSFVARHLVTNYDADPDITKLVDDMEWFLVPIVNPDGYERNDRYNANRFDLNRDWTSPVDESERFSQPETRSMRDFLHRHRSVRVHVDLHSAGLYILWPWGVSDELIEEHFAFECLAKRVARRIRDYRGTAYDRLGSISSTLYRVSGTATDYTYYQYGTWSFTFETGRTFTPSVREIVPMGLEIFNGLASLAQWVSTRPPNTVFVRSGASGRKSGASWADAYGHVEDGICDVARGAQEIWVAGGTYTPSPGGTQSFSLIDGTILLGGFIGDETHREQRNPWVNRTELSCDLRQDDLPGLRNREDNCAHVLTAMNTVGQIVVDGFVITGGHANNSEKEISVTEGGGIRLQNANVRFQRCAIHGNYAVSGSAASIREGIVHFAHCAILLNSGFSAAIGVTEADLSLANCLVIGNTGSGIIATGGRLTLDNCTIVENRGRGGVNIFGGNSATLKNCIVWRNEIPGSSHGPESAQVRMVGSTTRITLECTTIQGWTGLLGGVGNDGLDPQFVASGYWTDPLMTADWRDDLWIPGIYELGLGSPAINSGCPHSFTKPPGTDVIGNPRIQGCGIDRGAFESQAGQAPGDFNASGRVDLRDVAYLQLCHDATIARPEWAETCSCVFDLDKNGHVGLTDLPRFAKLLTGPK